MDIPKVSDVDLQIPEGDCVFMSLVLEKRFYLMSIPSLDMLQGMDLGSIFFEGDEGMNYSFFVWPLICL